MVSFLQQLSLALEVNNKETLLKCQNSWLKSQHLLQVILKNCLETQFNLSPKIMFKLFQLCFDLQLEEEEMSNFQILLQLAKSLLLKANMNYKTYLTIFQWKSFLSQSQMSSYAEDWSQILHFTKSFIDIKNAYKYHGNDVHCYKDTFQAGSGKIIEVITTWIVDDNKKAKDLKNEELSEFFKIANLHFPCSMQSDILKAHLCWEYCHR